MMFLKSRRLLFLKTRKTAGTSIEVALSELVVPGDGSVITPLNPAEDLARFRELGVHPQGTRAPFEVEKAYCDALARGDLVDIADCHHKLRQASTFFNHVPLRTVAAELGSELDDVTIFTVERRAEERLGSLLRYKRDLGHLPSPFGVELPDQLRSMLVAFSPQLRNAHIYDSHVLGRPVRVLDYHNLHDQLSEIIGDGPVRLTNQKKSARTGHRPHRGARAIATWRCRSEEAALDRGWSA